MGCPPRPSQGPLQSLTPIHRGGKGSHSFTGSLGTGLPSGHLIAQRPGIPGSCILLAFQRGTRCRDNDRVGCREGLKHPLEGRRSQNQFWSRWTPGRLAEDLGSLEGLLGSSGASPAKAAKPQQTRRPSPGAGGQSELLLVVPVQAPAPEASDPSCCAASIFLHF